ncbi:hypothetical protein [uncultured Neglectibacter sp.]|uniref:hypothetical protein n=1 Tax=uncultured Neglectibacter sp. TaxID=1924108 RepID=UPI0034DF3B7A
MREKKLNFRFHDPNSEARIAEYILELFFEVDREKVEQAIQAADFDDLEDCEAANEESKEDPTLAL